MEGGIPRVSAGKIIGISFPFSVESLFVGLLNVTAPSAMIL
jgi:hypothetical protein